MPARKRLFIEVVGTPAPQGSKRHVGGGRMVESSAKVAPWREDVKLAALRALEACPDWDCMASSISMHAVFVLARPRSHYRTGRYENLLRDGAPSYVSTKPDLDKLLRSTCDALSSAGVWADDCRLASVHARKVYPGGRVYVAAPLTRPGARLTLEQNI